MQSYSSILCTDFERLKDINRSTEDSLTTLLLGYIGFRARTAGNILITTVEKIANFLGVTIFKARQSMRKLEKLGVITPKITIDRAGYKRTSIKVNVDELPVFDYEKLSIIRKYTQDDELSLLYSFIAFKLSGYDKCNQPAWLKKIDEKVFWKISLKFITEQLRIKERTASEKLRKLVALGLLDRHKEGGYWYCTVNQNSYERIEKEYKALLNKKQPSCNFCVPPPAESTSYSLNNTYTDDYVYINNNTKQCDIILNNIDDIGQDLSKRQSAYLLGAIKNVAAKARADVEEVFGWIKFAILNPCQRRGITTFTHAVNRFVKLLREKKLTMPFGYKKYTEAGRAYAERMSKYEEKDEWWLKDGVTSSSELADKVISQQEEIEKWRDALDVDDYEQSVVNDDKGVEMGEMGEKETRGVIMYENEKDDDMPENIGFQWRMARGMFTKREPVKQATTTTIEKKDYELNKSMQINYVNKLVDEGAKQFAGHEDVVRKLLGVKA